jgi:hypothetical protein
VILNDPRGFLGKDMVCQASPESGSAVNFPFVKTLRFPNISADDPGKAEMNGWAIRYDPKRAPCFGPTGVSNHCNGILESWTDLDDASANDTVVNERMANTSSFDIQVTENEVFEIPQ